MPDFGKISPYEPFVRIGVQGNEFRVSYSFSSLEGVDTRKLERAVMSDIKANLKKMSRAVGEPESVKFGGPVVGSDGNTYWWVEVRGGDLAAFEKYARMKWNARDSRFGKFAAEGVARELLAVARDLVARG